MPDSLPSASDILICRQQSLLLHHLAMAPEGKLSQSDANKALKPYEKQLGVADKLTAKEANKLRGSMFVSGWLLEEKLKRVVTYTITDAGRQHLREIIRYLPLLPVNGEVHPPADEHARLAREAYILDAMAHAANTTLTRADLDVGFGGKPKVKVPELKKNFPHVLMFRDQECLKLNGATTRAVLSELAFRGDVHVERTADSEAYTITPSGMALLERLRGQCPILPPTGKITAAPNDSIRQGREAFVLLKLLQSAKYTLWGSDSTAGTYPKSLKLNHATAWKVRDELVRQGHIATAWDGKEGCYTLTEAGKRYLTTLPFDVLGEIKLKGSALTELLAAARIGEKPTAAALASTGEQLEVAVMDIFQELLRERFTVLDMVPIHEIRQVIAERYGPQAASHAVLDEAILNLRRAKKLRLISISDRSRVTPEQLQDSVIAVGETFFYAEKGHATTDLG